MRVLVTGGAGNIGSAFARRHPDRFDLVLTDRPDADLDAVASFGRAEALDLSDLDGLKRLCADVDAVLHLAADPSPSAPWSSVLESNITATYHAFVAAKAANCRRVVYASSIHAVSGYPPDRQVRVDDPVNPGDLYGVSKCFGEALARYMAEQEGVPSIAVRIGAFLPADTADDDGMADNLELFAADDDLCDLLALCLEAPDDVRWAIVHGISDARFKRLDLTDTKLLLGYDPQHDVAEENPALAAAFTGPLRTATLQDESQESGLREQL